MRRMFSLKQLQEIADSEVKSLVEGGTLENAKPVYCHPVELYKTATGTLCCLIFNNSSEQIDTWEKLKTAIHNFGGTQYNRLVCTGSLKDGDGNLIIGSEIIEDVSSQSFALYGMQADGTSRLETPLVITGYNWTSLTDGVNKIN